jgi:hypothetical protein
MITPEEWWGIMGAYGAGIWPAQVVFYLAAIFLAGWLLFQPGRAQSWFAKLYLSIAFAWNGIVFFLVLARDITGGSYGNYFFGSIFIIVSVLLAVDLFRKKMLFALPATGWRKHATLALMILVFCYPLFGMAWGHHVKALIIPGTFPCPTTAFGLLLLTTALPRVDKIAYILLLFWAIPFPPFIQIPKYGVYEDGIMFASGVYSLFLLLRDWKVGNPRG